MSRSRARAPRALAVALVCAVLLVGCSSETGNQPTPTTAPAVAGSAGPGVSSVGQAAVAGPEPVDWSQPGPGLRGKRLTTGLRCRPADRLTVQQWRQEQRGLDDPGWAPEPHTQVRGTVELIRMCPSRWDPYPRRDLVAGTEQFALAMAALGAPDGRPLDGLQLCGLQGNPTVMFLARTARGTWLLHIPEDPCGHPVDRMSVLYRALLA